MTLIGLFKFIILLVEIFLTACQLSIRIQFKLVLVITYLEWRFGINFPQCIFENFEVAWVKREQLQNFQKSRKRFIASIAQAKHLITGWSHQVKRHFGLKLISLTVGNYKSASGQLQKNTVNSAISITVNSVIII